MNENEYCVVYRTGGTARYKWSRTLAMTRLAALDVCTALVKQGYKAFPERYRLSMSIGLPETYDSAQRPID